MLIYRYDHDAMKDIRIAWHSVVVVVIGLVRTLRYMRGDTLMWNAGVETTLGLVCGMLALPDTHAEVLMSLGRAYMRLSL